MKALGIEWVETGGSRPESGVEIKNMALAEALYERCRSAPHTRGTSVVAVNDSNGATKESASRYSQSGNALTARERGQNPLVHALAKAIWMFDESTKVEAGFANNENSAAEADARQPAIKPRKVVGLSDVFQILKGSELGAHVKAAVARRIFVEMVTRAPLARGAINQRKDEVMNKSMYHTYVHAIAKYLGVHRELVEHEEEERKRKVESMVRALAKAMSLFDYYSEAAAMGSKRAGVGEENKEDGAGVGEENEEDGGRRRASEMRRSSKEQEERRREVQQLLTDAGLDEHVVEAVASEECAKLEAKGNADDRQAPATPSSSRGNLSHVDRQPASKPRRVVGLSDVRQILEDSRLGAHVQAAAAGRIFVEMVTQAPLARGAINQRRDEVMNKSMYHTYVHAIAKYLGVHRELVEHEETERKRKVMHVLPGLVKAMSLFDHYSEAAAKGTKRTGARLSLREVQQIIKDVHLDVQFNEAYVEMTYARVVADERKRLSLLHSMQAPVSRGTRKPKNNEVLDKSMYRTYIYALAKSLGIEREFLERETAQDATDQSQAMQNQRVSFTPEEFNRIWLPDLRRDSYVRAFGAVNRYFTPDPAGVVGHWPLAKEAQWQQFTHRFSPSKMREVMLSNLSELTVIFLRDTAPTTDELQLLLRLLDSIDGNVISIPKIWAAMPGHRAKRPGPQTVKGMVCVWCVCAVYVYASTRMRTCNTV